MSSKTASLVSDSSSSFGVDFGSGKGLSSSMLWLDFASFGVLGEGGSSNDSFIKLPGRLLDSLSKTSKGIYNLERLRRLLLTVVCRGNL